MRKSAKHLLRAYASAHEEERENAVRSICRAHRYLGILEAKGETWPDDLRVLSAQIIERLA